MPKGVYKELRCFRPRKNEFTLKEHQQKTVNYFLNSPHKGLLLYHLLGSGKTCTAVNVADMMIKNNKVKHVFVLSPGSLRSTWKKEYCDKCGYKPYYLENYYTFLTYNYNISSALELLSFENSLVVIDEVHNLINGVKNQSKTFENIYKKIVNSNCRVLALSGTPIYNYVEEWSYLGNMLKPNSIPSIIIDGKIESDLFTFLFRMDERGNLIPENPTKVKRMLEGIVSYFPGNKEDMPDVLHMEPIKIFMTLDQEAEYLDMEKIESMFSFPPPLSLKFRDPEKYEIQRKLYIICKKRLLTRATSNIYWSPIMPRKRKPSVENNELSDDDAELLIEEAEMFEEGQENEKDIDRQVRQILNIGLENLSPKFVALLTNITIHMNQKHVVFTYFKEKGGVNILKALLEHCGIPCLLFTGDMTDSNRASTLRRFNNDNNRYGEKFKVLFITEAGAEGISTNNVRHFHIIDSTTRVNKENQAIGRIARLGSHASLPEDERNIKVWRYWSILANESEGWSHAVDTSLYIQGKYTERKILSFLNLLKENSVLEN